MTLTQALVRSINIIPVKLSIALGNGNPKIGRAKIRDTARKAGLRTPLPDTPSMPIGADEVTVLDHTGGYTMFPNLGKAATPHAVLEVRSGAGELIWRWDRDGKIRVERDAANRRVVPADEVEENDERIAFGTARAYAAAGSPCRPRRFRSSRRASGCGGSNQPEPVRSKGSISISSRISSGAKSATRRATACAVSVTSWTRMMCAPH